MEAADISENLNIKLLFVDDEPHILSSLKRLFRRDGYNILTAESGEQGLELLESEPVDLIISDMRMPGMNGAEFLEKSLHIYPDTVRILLTGYSDMTSTIDAINKGKIYSYISKPWEDNHIKVTVSQALKCKLIEKERDNLLKLTKQQNDQLTELNDSLEKKVSERTQQLLDKSVKLEDALERLESNYDRTIRVFSNLIEMCDRSGNSFTAQLADNAKSFCEYMGLSKEVIQNVYFASLLHNIGKITMAESLWNKPYNLLSKDEASLFQKHPELSHMALMGLEELTDVANIILHHKERHDGKGYPKSVKGEDIPLESKILKIVTDYEELRHGLIVNERLSDEKTVVYLERLVGKHYDPELLKKFITFNAEEKTNSFHKTESCLCIQQLSPGMVLSRDLIDDKGILLLPKDSVINENYINTIREYLCRSESKIKIYIKPAA